MSLQKRILKCATENGADLVGFAGIGRFHKNNAILKIFPQTKTVIGLSFRVLRGCHRGIEEGSTYFQYTTMGVESLEETVMPLAQLKVCGIIEDESFYAVPQRRHQTIMAEYNSTNPEIVYESIFTNKPQENQIDFLQAAIQCGLGEIGLGGSLLTDDFGPLQRYCFILTDASIEESPVVKPHLCDKCGKCIKACPGKAISETGELDLWQCAAYYKGASGLKNPFMPSNAFADFDDRLEIIASKLKLSPEEAKEVIENTTFYPPVLHSYASSICGRACDRECYIHLEKKGVLNKKFHSKFRKREEWKFNIEDFYFPHTT